MTLSACSTKTIYRTKIVRPPISYNAPCIIPKAVPGDTYKNYILDLIDSLKKCSLRNAKEEEWFDQLQEKAHGPS